MSLKKYKAIKKANQKKSYHLVVPKKAQNYIFVHFIFAKLKVVLIQEEVETKNNLSVNLTKTVSE
jgi:hypothetical protein